VLNFYSSFAFDFAIYTTDSMKYFTLLFCSLIFSSSSFSQTTVSDYVILGPQYANQSFYSLANGEAANTSNTLWDLQLATAQRSASIRINDAKDVQLFELPNSDTTEWNAIDTSGKYRLYNADTSWEIGAFNNIGSLQHPDYGCMVYTGTGQLRGTRLFMLKLANGQLKKVWIKQLDFYVLTILISNLDNSDLQTIVLDKNNFSSKNFFYYSIENDSALDIEPEALEWDFVSRKYFALDSITYLPFNAVTGVLLNRNVSAVDIRGVNLATIDSDTGYTYSNYINTIGYDWKSYDYDSSKFDLVSNLGYFIKAQDGDIYKLEFTGFAGSLNGRVDFKKTNLSQNTAASTNDKSSLNSLTVYPNPATENASIIISLKENKNLNISIYDASGKIIFTQLMEASAGLNNFSLPIQNFENGFYFVKVNDKNSALTQKLLIAH